MLLFNLLSCTNQTPIDNQDADQTSIDNHDTNIVKYLEEFVEVAPFTHVTIIGDTNTQGTPRTYQVDEYEIVGEYLHFTSSGHAWARFVHLSNVVLEWRE